MRVSVTVCNTVPTKHAHRVLQPRVEISDEVQVGETPLQAYKRISAMANAMWARELLDQLRFTDRMQQSDQGNEQWCDEFLSTLNESHPAMNVVPSASALPPGVRETLHSVGEAIGDAAVQALEKALGSSGVPTPEGQ